MTTTNFHRILAALSLALTVAAVPALAQTTKEMPAGHGHGMMHGQTAQEDSGDSSPRCDMMKKKQEKMMAKCKAMDSKLDELAAAMNSATGQEKIEAMAALLNELVAQRKAMHSMMHTMMGKKMGMMSSSGEGMSKDGKSKCNMMKEKMMKKSEEAGAETSGQ